MEHHIARDLLGAYVDDELEPVTREALEAHLAGCPACRSLLPDADGAPRRVELAADAAPAGWDERHLRRAVRATLVRTTLSAALIAVALILVLGLLADVVLGPVVARGDRVQQAIQLTHDLPLLFTPGASVGELTKESVGGRVHVNAQLNRAVGGGAQPLGEYRIELTARSMRASETLRPPFFNFDGTPVGAHPTWQPDRVDADTVATVQLSWREPLSMSAVDALVDDDVDAALLWVAFAVDPLRGTGVMGAGALWDPSIDVGFSTCSGLSQDDLDKLADPRRGGDVGGWAPPLGVDGALEEVRRATANLAEADELLAPMVTDAPVLLRIDEVAAWLADNEPTVTSLVITGPSDALAAVITDADPDDARVLGIDFYNWEEPFC
jgi:hypothetical protein